MPKSSAPIVVVGVGIYYEVIGQSGSMMMMVSVSGTAVKLK